jgi:hypothetical protein
MLSNDVDMTGDEAGHSMNQMREYIAFDKYFQWLRSARIPYDNIFTEKLGLYDLFPMDEQKIWCS